MSPNRQRHRGPHPADRELFSGAARARLRAAAVDYCHLLSRGYGAASALKLVGDRHELHARQRKGVERCSCAEAERARRLASRVEMDSLDGSTVAIDGFNQLITLETAIDGGVVLRGRDGAYRDLSGVHGTWRRLVASGRALEALGEVLVERGVARATWFVDRPVSNSGRLAEMIRALGDERHWRWTAEVVADADAVLLASSDIVITSDSRILDGCQRWAEVMGMAMQRAAKGAWVVDLE